MGWDAHINCGVWREKELRSGIEATTGKPCDVRTIESAWHPPSEYDVTDTNSLIEWVHAAVVRVVKRMMDEHQIDQEIDFDILRGDRQDMVGRSDPTEKKASPQKRLFRRAD